MKIQINLSKASIDSAINQLKAYQKSLDDKNQLFVKRLAELGIPIIDMNIVGAKGDSDTTHDTEIRISHSKDIAKAVLSVSGKDVLFFEFGAGIRYNNGNIHPKASEFGYGVGTYPGQIHAINPGYWWYKDEGDGQVHLSFGTEATMPMLKASNEIISKIRKIAREVYGSK